jgi:SAM-dependent methyltransferase
MRSGTDGSAGDADYGVLGPGYAGHRRPDPAIRARIEAALGDARSVLNVGAGTGSYEPEDREVTAVEPSAVMREQRPPRRPRAIDAVAEALPFGDGAFDAAMTTFSVHQWRDLAAGLAEFRRVTRGPVVVLTCDPDRVGRFWLSDYAPEVLRAEAERYPSPDRVARLLGGSARVDRVPVPLDCSDGFGEAYHGRPERFLDRSVRQAMSAWSFVDPEVISRFERDLARDLRDGSWDARWGRLRTQPEFDGSLVLITASP